MTFGTGGDSVRIANWDSTQIAPNDHMVRVVLQGSSVHLDICRIFLLLSPF